MYSVLSLFVLTIGQTVIYTIIYEPKFLLRHMAMMGALMILLAEHQGLINNGKSLFYKCLIKMESPGKRRRRSWDYLCWLMIRRLIACSCLVVFVSSCCFVPCFTFGTRPVKVLFEHVRLHYTFFLLEQNVIHDPFFETTGVKKEVMHDFFGFVFIVLVTVGYHTRLSSLILIIWLGVMNFFVNNFWNTEDPR